MKLKIKTVTIIVALLGFLGFADAAYLTAERYLGLPLPCTTNGCETVLTSAYSSIGPIPLSLLGVLYYLMILFLAVQFYTFDNPGPRIPQLLFSLTVLGFLASCYFVYLQIFVIGALCMYCLGSAVIATLLLMSSFFILTPETTNLL